MANPDDLRELVERYARTVTSRDLDAYVALFTEDAIQGDPMNETPKLGHTGIREFMGGAFNASQGTEFRTSDVHCSGDHVAFHFAIEVTLDSGSMTISGIETFEVAADGRIKEVRAYWDQADVVFA